MSVLRLARQVAAAFLAITLVAGNVAACAGWTATPEARMACCSDGGACPMHGASSDDSAATHAISQADADRCCAGSEGDDSSSSPASTTVVVTLALVGSPVLAWHTEAPTRADVWNGSAPTPAPHVPKHLLLSVFLV